MSGKIENEQHIPESGTFECDFVYLADRQSLEECTRQEDIDLLI